MQLKTLTSPKQTNENKNFEKRKNNFLMMKKSVVVSLLSCDE